MIIQGDSLIKLKELEDNSVDSCITDPPYGLSFMGKKWDYDVPNVELWREVLRVLKPGAHLLAFGGTRTYHRLVCAIEDAGFEIRDQVQWIYGSGFPKSLDVSKAIDKMHGAEREVLRYKKEPYTNVAQNRSNSQGKNWNCKTDENGYILTPVTAPSTEDAKRWQGFGTALKPANEPICLARKPLEKGLTVAENVLKWGCGALNIDGCRIEGAFQSGWSKSGSKAGENTCMSGPNYERSPKPDNPQGRWPANVLFDEQAAAVLDEMSGITKSTGGDGYKNSMFCGGKKTGGHGLGDVGGASRFFYVAKASKRERNKGLEGMPEKTPQHDFERIHTPTQNHHPTVKPIKLMEYLIKLACPPNGLVLDPFLGSGSTGVAAKNLGHKFIGIELNPEYAEIAEKRIEA